MTSYRTPQRRGNSRLRKRSSRYRLLFLSILGSALLASSVCVAATAEEFEEEGARQYLQKDYEAALRQFQNAYQLTSRPSFLYNIGQCYRRLERTSEAAASFQRYLVADPELNPVLRAELQTFIDQVLSPQSAQEPSRKADPPEPAPHLTYEEVVDLEEVCERVSAEFRAGRTASGRDLLNQIELAYTRRLDPVILFYLAKTLERVGKNADALATYRRYLSADDTSSNRRRVAREHYVLLLPEPPGRRLFFAGLTLGALGAAGLAAGLGLYYRSAANYEQFRDAGSELAKRELAASGQSLVLGSSITYGLGSGLLAAGIVLVAISAKRGLHKKPESFARTASLSIGLSGPIVLFQGAF